MNRRKTRFLSLLVCGVSFLLLPAITQASPFFAIGEGTGTTWTQAIGSGNVVPVLSSDGLTGAATSYYDRRLVNNPALDGYLLQTSTLIPDVLETDGYSETHLAMRMEWPVTGSSAPGNDVLDIAAWQYVYGGNRDLTGTFLTVSILPREGVTDLSIELIDANGEAMGWFKDGPVTEKWDDVTFDLSGQGDQNGFEFEPNLEFDITCVAKIRLDEAWRGKIYSYDTARNAWDSLVVTPEPTTLLLLGLGGLLATRRRR